MGGPCSTPEAVVVQDGECDLPLVGFMGYDNFGFMLAESGGDAQALQSLSEASSAEALCPWNSLQNRLARSAQASMALADVVDATYEHLSGSTPSIPEGRERDDDDDDDDDDRSCSDREDVAGLSTGCVPACCMQNVVWEGGGGGGWAMCVSVRVCGGMRVLHRGAGRVTRVVRLHVDCLLRCVSVGRSGSFFG